jgi:hypothetical protein
MDAVALEAVGQVAVALVDRRADLTQEETVACSSIGRWFSRSTYLK